MRRFRNFIKFDSNFENQFANFFKTKNRIYLFQNDIIRVYLINFILLFDIYYVEY